MLAWLRKRISRTGLRSKRGVIDLGEMGKLARAGPSVWLLTQEKARLDYLAAKEEYDRLKTRRAHKRVTDLLLQLQSINAIITSLINEHTLDQMLLQPLGTSPNAAHADVRRSA